MRHSWIFEVLSDLRDYALTNELPLLAQKVAEAEAIARQEIAAKAAVQADGSDET